MSSEAVAANSPLNRLRQVRESFRGDQHIDLPVPGYQGLLVARYAPVEYEVLRRIGERAERQRHNPEAELIAACDTLAHACQGLFYRDDAGNLEAVKHQGDPVRFDLGLAAVLDIKAETVREVIRSTFPDPLSIVSQYTAFSRWQTERDGEADDELAESDELRPTLSSSPAPPSSE